MPYVKINPTTGKCEVAYEIKQFNVNMDLECVMIAMSVIESDVAGILRTTEQRIMLSNEHQLLIDPAWDTTWTPPKPIGFNPNDATTWNGLTADQFPYIVDTTKQYFSAMLIRDFAGLNIGERIKTALYQYCIETGKLPIGAEWQLR